MTQNAGFAAIFSWINDNVYRSCEPVGMPHMQFDPANRAGGDRRATILLVEDDADIRAIFAIAISLDAGITLVEADQGSAALAYLQDYAVPDLILIDNMLPDMKGLELMKIVHQQYPAAGKRIAFFTASVRDEDMQRYKAAGAIGVIEKPFDTLKLSSLIRKLI